MTSAIRAGEVFPLAKSKNIVLRELNDELLIYNLQTHKAFCLNETSATVWQHCDGKNNVEMISRILSEKLNLPANEELIWLTLDELKREHLLANPEQLEKTFKGFSRREVIRKVGLASVAALPVIYSLVAPTAASAQSGGVCANPSFDSCTTDDDCLTSPTGDTCDSNCCVFGGGIPGGFCIPNPSNPPCPPPCVFC